MESAVKDIVQKAHSDSAEQRRSRRLEAQSSRRNLTKQDFNTEISDKEAKTLSNLCKSGKLTVSQFRDLSRALSSKPEFSLSFLTSDGCLHGLVGQLTGSDPAKQLLALQCLVNLAGQGHKCPLVAKSAGAYLITLLKYCGYHLLSLCLVAHRSMAKVLPCLLITIGVAFMWQSAFVPPPGGRMNMGAIHLSTAAGAMLGGGAARADVESAAKKLADASYPMVKAVDWATTDVLDKYMATVPTTKEFSKAILELSVAMDPTLIKNAVQAHKTAVGAMGPNFVTPLKNHEEVTVALAKLFAAAPKDKIQAVFDATPGVQDLNSAWYAKMPKADADATFSAFKELADVVKASPTKVVTPAAVTAGGPIADAAKKLADTSYPLVKAVDWANTGPLDNFVAKTPATKASIAALLDAGLAMDPKLIQSATQAHLKALDAADGSLVTPLSNFEDVTVAVAKLIASAPASKIQAVFDTTPNVQGLNADWFAKMPVADAISSYQAFLDTASVVKAR